MQEQPTPPGPERRPPASPAGRADDFGHPCRGPRTLTRSPGVNFRTPLHELRSVYRSSAGDRGHLACPGSYARRDDLTCVPVRDDEDSYVRGVCADSGAVASASV